MAWYGRQEPRMSELMDFVEALYEASGGVPSAGLVQTATVTLTDAQIRALVNVPIEIIPAPGANKVITLVLPGPGGLDSRQTVAYTNDSVDLTVGFICFGYALSTFGARNIINYGADAWMPFSQPNATPTIDTSVGPEALPGLVNQPVSVFIGNFAGDLTGGNAANTLTVTVYYTIVDVP